MTEPAYITISLHKGCILALTEAEWRRGIRRGKAQRHREANERRQQCEGSLAEVLDHQSERHNA